MRLTREHLDVQVLAGRAIAGPSFAPQLHTHPEWELTLIRRGSGTRLVGDAVCPFQPGEIVLLAPDLPHTWASTPATAPDGVAADVVHFTRDVASLLQQLDPLSPLHAVLLAAPYGVTFTAPPAGGQEVLAELAGSCLPNGRSLAAFLTLLEWLATTEWTVSTGTLSPPARPGDSRRLEAVCDYVLRRHRETVTAAQAAQVAAMTPSAFSRFFRQAMHRTFTDYVTEVRLNNAATLLRDTDLPVSAIAVNSGYLNLANFNRRFRERYATTPLKYRRSFNIRPLQAPAQALTPCR